MTSWGGNISEEHQRLRELLGSYALGHLDDADEAMVGAHLDGCASCRADLDEIAPLAGLLERVDASRFDLPAVPPSDLGALIRAQVAGERELRESDELDAHRARSRHRAAIRASMGAVAAAVVLAVLVGGFAIGRGTVDETVAPTPPPTTETVTATPTAPAVTLEAVDLSVDRPRITIDTAGLVAHSWGLELRMRGSGFAQGEVFRASFRSSESGELETAGAFVGTGRDELTCSLQSAVIRADATEVVIVDASGEVVLDAPL